MRPQTLPNVFQSMRFSPFVLFSFLIALASLVNAAPGPSRTPNGGSAKPGMITRQQAPSVGSSPVQSFGEWKEQKIHAVQLEVEALQARIEANKADASSTKGGEKVKSTTAPDPSLMQLKNQLINKTYSLEMAKELTVADYFAAYLTKLDNKKESFKEIAAKMTAEEVADLMSAYANAMFSGQGSSAAPQGLNAPFDRVK